MLRAQKLYISRLAQIALLFVPTFAVAQTSVALSSDRNIFPATGARPELLTVFDMRRDSNQAERILAKSAEGLMNSDPQRTDKIYLVLNNTDRQWLQWLVQKQYVLSSAEMHDMEELIRRYPDRGALIADTTYPGVCAAVAGCERLLVVTDPSLVKKYHLVVKKDLRGKWQSEQEANQWLFDHYADQMSKRILAVLPAGHNDLDLLDYEIGAKVFTFSVSGDEKDQSTLQMLIDKFPANIPCLTLNFRNDQPLIDKISFAGKFLMPTGGLSNLTVWTSFRPYGAGVEEINRGATARPRALYADPYGIPQGGWLADDNRPGKMQMPWLIELAPPIYEAWAKQRNGGLQIDRDAFRLGEVNDSVYADSYGADKDRIWAQYRRMCNDVVDRSSGR